MASEDKDPHGSATWGPVRGPSDPTLPPPRPKASAAPARQSMQEGHTRDVILQYQQQASLTCFLE